MRIWVSAFAVKPEATVTLKDNVPHATLALLTLVTAMVPGEIVRSLNEIVGNGARKATFGMSIVVTVVDALRPLQSRAPALISRT
jgi:hypothetical protein